MLANQKSLLFKGKLIGKDSEGVMLELDGASGCHRMFVPYEMLDEGMVADLEAGMSVGVAMEHDGSRAVLTMKIDDADQA